MERVGFLGFPRSVWIMLAVEFAERLGYYAVAFTLFTYCTNMLRTRAAAANAIINGLYIVIPIAACASSGLADGRWGRPKTLAFFLGLYVVSLLLLTWSSLPLMYAAFPEDPRTVSYLLFGTSIALFGAGYGGVKVCTNPIMADSLVRCLRDGAAPAEDVTFVNDFGEARPREEQPGPRAAHAELAGEGPVVVVVDGNGGSSDASDTSGATEQALARLFRVVYWVANCGGLIGILLAPLLRGLDNRTVTLHDGATTYTTGYYYGNAMAALSVAVGAALFALAYRYFPRAPPAPSFVLFRVVGRALYYRLAFCCEWVHDEAFRETRAAGDWLSYGTYRPHGDVNDVDVDDADADLTSPAWVADCRSTMRVCKAFVALPIYWLICNQFSTNLMYQAAALDMPAWMPPEMFNNLNTITLLVFLLLCEHYVFPRLFGVGVAPPARGRVVLGFLLMFASMLWCAAVQLAIVSRGSYDPQDEHYVLRPGAQKLSAMWLAVPYICQGIAAALVDPAVMEVAYVAAPARMKGTVMALYWMASSASGFLGLLLSPVMKPNNAVPLFLFFAFSLLTVTVLFYKLNGPGAYDNTVRTDRVPAAAAAAATTAAVLSSSDPSEDLETRKPAREEGTVVSIA